MRSALHPDVLRELSARAAKGMLLAFDLDGTLAPIVARPQDARVPEALSALLRTLAARHPVAVITGRAAADARALLAFEPRYVVGNHGAEGLPGREAAAESFRARSEAWREALVALDLGARCPGIALEDKRYSLSLHYRLASDHDAARGVLLDAVTRLSPAPRIVEGKCVLNLVAPDAPHKGDALAALVADSGTPHALYVGDDTTDEDAFRADLPGVYTVCIAPAAATAAQFVLSRQEDMHAFLAALAHREATDGA